LIGIKRGIQWRDYGGLRDADVVSIELVQPNRTPVRIFNIYNRNTLSRINLASELNSATQWIVAGDVNAHHPRWSRADREPSDDWRNVLPIVNAGTLAIEPGTITRIGSVGQRSSAIDLVISGPGRGIDSLHATIAEDLRTGSDHEVIT
jgi:endonuclease/exonuclease/phosphatase family metal-dependent hydrolase